MTGPETPTPPTDPVVAALTRWRTTISKGVGVVVFGLVLLWFVLGPESTMPLLTIALVLMVALLIGQLTVTLIVASRRSAGRQAGDTPDKD